MQRINCGSCYCGTPGLTCVGCSFPAANLTVTWDNVVLAGGTATLTFDGVDGWSTTCARGLIFRLRCAAGALTFTATYFTGAPCPGGTPVTCSPSSSLTQCSPLMLKYVVTTPICPGLHGQGVRNITVTL